MIIYQKGKKFIEYGFQKEDEFERILKRNCKKFFGDKIIYIDSKKKIHAKALGGTVPDGILIDFSDKANPEFYLIEIELSKHSFYSHIFPQITKFFAFFKNSKSRNNLVEKIFSIINSDSDLKNEFKEYLFTKEIYKFLKDLIEKSQNILLILDGEKFEIPEIMETYYDTWGKIVKIIIIKKFINKNESVFTIDPEFENLEYSDIEYLPKDEPEEDYEYSEDIFLNKVNKNIKDLYNYLKKKVIELDNSIIFNPKKYYVSIVYKKNIAFIKIRQKKIRVVIVYPEDKVRNIVKNHNIIKLSSGVQKFYGGDSCTIEILNKDNIDEILELIKKMIETI